MRDRSRNRFIGGGFSPAQELWTASIGMTKERNQRVQLVNLPPNGEGDIRDFHDTQWQQRSGWFSASYGPFRRFTGGDREEERLREARPISGRHLSLFRENISLTGTLRWLESLQFRKLEADPEGALLDAIQICENKKGSCPIVQGCNRCRHAGFSLWMAMGAACSWRI